MNKHTYIPTCTFQSLTLDTGETVLYDTKDHLKIIECHWHNNNKYAATGHVGFRMHHLVLGLTEVTGFHVHHKDGNTFNNCKDNLQILSVSNHLITRSAQQNNKSGYKGVSWKNPQGNKVGKWIAQISKNGKKYSIGRFDTPEAAARAYDAKAKVLFGDVAYLNFPND